MNVTGYAFKANKSEIQKRYRDRYEQIKHLKDKVDIEMTPDYKRGHFDGTIDESSEEAMNLSAEDLFILMTEGFIPFGGFIEKHENTFSGDEYQD